MHSGVIRHPTLAWGPVSTGSHAIQAPACPLPHRRTSPAARIANLPFSPSLLVAKSRPTCLKAREERPSIDGIWDNMGTHGRQWESRLRSSIPGTMNSYAAGLNTLLRLTIYERPDLLSRCVNSGLAVPIAPGNSHHWESPTPTRQGVDRRVAIFFQANRQIFAAMSRTPTLGAGQSRPVGQARKRRRGPAVQSRPARGFKLAPVHQPAASHSLFG